MRIGRAQMFMEIAGIVAKRSTCFRLNVGAVITVKDRIVSIGYNGRPSGQPHCQGEDCPGRFGCTETTHAEANAFQHLPQSLVGHECNLYTTDSPCADCASIAYTWNARRVYFARPYRITEPLDWLVGKGVEVYRVTPAGYVIQWPSGAVIDAP